eukprot:gnl/Trimastix_PCT/4525.p1 GENE.gnl/Trimastix_PCT/4525~~gnl/Trimastix_PCT/4525.p1  ORF type:complete len:461 (+),score=26.28 gnl/Trimastix_PCT/4525:51-1433(+)
MRAVIFVALCLPLLLALDRIPFQEEGIDDPKYWNQKLDHFNPADTRTFAQKYYVDDISWRKPDGPIFLYIGGESPLPGRAGGFINTLVQRHSGMAISLEHRYYGESQPFSKLTTKNLQFLSVEQALEDLAHFAKWYQKVHINQRYGTQGFNKWILVGGSYAGMLSCEARQIHQDIFAAALSSSGVVQAVIDFTDCDRQAAIGLGEECSKLARECVWEMDRQLARGPEAGHKIKASFNASVLNDFDFRCLIADAITIGPQYSNREPLCDALIEANNEGSDLMAAFQDFVNGYFYPRYCQGGAKTYMDEYLERVEPAGELGSRVWWYQLCTQFGFFQTAPKGRVSVRSPGVTLGLFQQKCKNIFGASMAWPPKAREFNKRYGALHPNVTRVIFTQGSQDPWQWAGIRNPETFSPSTENHVFVMTGPNVGHCVDLGYDMFWDPPDVQRTREQISELLGKWIQH